MIQLDSTYLTELKKKLEYEQWSSTAAKKLQDSEFKDLIECAIYFIEHDGKIITARGAGVCIEFGLKLAELAVSKEKAEHVKSSIQCAW